MTSETYFEGIDNPEAMEGAIQRWVHRLEPMQPIGNCSVHINIAPTLFGFSKRARVELEALVGSERIEVTLTMKYRGHEDLYLLISDAFREVRRQLVSLRARGTIPPPLFD
jgi:ribosome-associated translation inhibitor RaiA